MVKFENLLKCWHRTASTHWKSVDQKCLLINVDKCIFAGIVVLHVPAEYTLRIHPSQVKPVRSVLLCCQHNLNEIFSAYFWVIIISLVNITEFIMALNTSIWLNWLWLMLPIFRWRKSCEAKPHPQVVCLDKLSLEITLDKVYQMRE